jgi:dipeptidase E
MKMVLCSEGFHTPNTVQACVDLVGKPQDKISVAIINEGFAVEEGDKRWVLDNLNDVSKHFPAQLDIVDLLALSIEEVETRINFYDVIFVLGGNTDYLMHVFNKSGFTKLLPKLLESKVYVGSSAGSMVIGKRVSTEAYLEIFGEADDFGITEYLGLVDFAFKPHLDSPYFPNNTAEVIYKVSHDLNYPLYALRDDSAIVVNGEKLTLIGSEPFRVG